MGKLSDIFYETWQGGQVRLDDAFEVAWQELEDIVHANAAEKDLFSGERFGKKLQEEAEEAFCAYESIAKSEKIPGFSHVEEELADIVILIMSYAKKEDWDIAGAITAKIEYNATRPKRHRKEF